MSYDLNANGLPFIDAPVGYRPGIDPVPADGTPVSASALNAIQVAQGTYADSRIANEALARTTADAALAPLNSPAFTGSPTVSTAPVDTSTSRAASTAFVIGQASSATPLVDGTATAGVATQFARADHVHPAGAGGGGAPLNSPAFTGTPTAPTPAAGTNTTQLATSAYADAATLVEKTRAQAAEALLAPLASPALTGNPTVPTQTAGDNSTRVASTAYVAAASKRFYMPSTASYPADVAVPTTANFIIAEFDVPSFATGQTVSLAKVRHRLTGSGTCTLKIRVNDVDATGFSFAMTSTEAVLDPTDIVLSAGDRVSVCATGTAVTPVGLKVTVEFLYAVSG